jgi:hypothetical protein
VSTPLGLAVDPAAGRLYRANATGNKISFANLDGSGGSDLATPGATLQGASFPVLLQTPRGSSAPAVSSSSGTLVGATLSCSPGTWAPDLTASFDYRAPLSFAFGWTRNGAQIAGATSNSITAASPGNFNCQVTALNRAVVRGFSPASASDALCGTEPPRRERSIGDAAQEVRACSEPDEIVGPETAIKPDGQGPGDLARGVSGCGAAVGGEATTV